MYHDDKLPQADYDCLVIGDGEKFAKNLEKESFIYGSKNSDFAKILKKAKVKSLEDKFENYVFLDLKIYSGDGDTLQILNKIADFTISAVALDIKDLFEEDWQDRVISLPESFDDMENKVLRPVNLSRIKVYKIIRMASQGFKLSNNFDFQKVKSQIIQEKSEKELEKTIRYVGSREKVTQIAKELNIDTNSFI